jgi:hypothetical protein
MPTSFSYWEKTSLYTADYIIVGGGLTGLQTAIHLRQLQPKAKVMILEKEVFSAGASTKNAGFACFANATELLTDFAEMGESNTLSLVQQRFFGLNALREQCGDNIIDYHHGDSYEVFFPDDSISLDEVSHKLPAINNMLSNAIGVSEVFQVTTFNENPAILNHAEGRLDTGRLISALRSQARALDIEILSGVEVVDVEKGKTFELISAGGHIFNAGAVAICTNAFARELLEVDVLPVRNQVILTEPMYDLKWKGSFTNDQGYYYWRNIGNRLLIGGGRHRFPQSEVTQKLGNTEEIVEHLCMFGIDKLGLENFLIEEPWSGILGIDESSKGLPLIDQTPEGIYYGVRLGGMGVALSTYVGKELAWLINQNS